MVPAQISDLTESFPVPLLGALHSSPQFCVRYHERCGSQYAKILEGERLEESGNSSFLAKKT